MKPLLKWAGGKTWLLKQLQEFLPKSYNNYHEPFVGGGAFFLNYNNGEKRFLSDTNEELINFYLAIKHSHHSLHSELLSYETNKDFYYNVREQSFEDKIKKAARFYYLNQHCYNGLYRVNRKNKFNVPYGRPVRDFEPNIDEFTLASQQLANTEVFCGDFEESLKNIKENDLVFLDPPYTVAHNLNGFVAYNQKIFSWADQERLAKYIEKIKDIGAYYILTNANHQSTIELYGTLGNISIIERHSTIGNLNSRKRISEILLSNC